MKTEPQKRCEPLAIGEKKGIRSYPGCNRQWGHCRIHRDWVPHRFRSFPRKTAKGTLYSTSVTWRRPKSGYRRFYTYRRNQLKTNGSRPCWCFSAQAISERRLLMVRELQKIGGMRRNSPNGDMLSSLPITL